MQEALPVIVQNTVAVLTLRPERREQWAAVLGQLQAQAALGGQGDFAQFLSVLRELVDGLEPGHLAPSVPKAFRAPWNKIVEGLCRPSPW